MQAYSLNAAIIFYACAMGLELTYLVQRHEGVHRFATLSTLAGWIAHTLALIHLAVELGQPPFGSVSYAISVAVWVAVLLEMVLERRWGLKVLGAFVMPVVLVFSLKAVVAGPPVLIPDIPGPRIWVHISLAMMGIAAFVLNFAGAVMYLLQERQIRYKRPGRVYYRLPSLETLDHLTYRTLAIGFPFLTVGLILGALSARGSWGALLVPDPLAFSSIVVWLIYAGTLAGRTAGGWRGRRAAYFAIVGFVALVLTLGAGLFLPGRHGV